MLLIFIFAQSLARFLALAHTRVFLLTQRFLLSYILMKIFLFIRQPSASKASSLVPRVCLGAKRTLFAFFPLAAFVPRVCLGAKRTLFAAPLSFWPKTKNSVFDLKQLRFFTAKTCAPLFRSSPMLLTKADIERLSLRSAWSFALHYFTSPRFARLGLSPCTILQALASLGLFKLGCGSANANLFAFALALH